MFDNCETCWMSFLGLIHQKTHKQSIRKQFFLLFIAKEITFSEKFFILTFGTEQLAHVLK